jgi:hypothetical protein
VSKIVTSPIKRFPGTVTLSDPLTFPQLLAFRESLERASQEDGDNFLASNYAILPGLLACVEEVHLQGFPEPVTALTFPATPPVSTARLIAWLIGEVNTLMAEAEPDPNE